LIKTDAASINPINYKILRGDVKAITKVVFPTDIGRDVSGLIVEVGSKEQWLKVLIEQRGKHYAVVTLANKTVRTEYHDE